MLIPQTWMIPY